MWYWAWFIWVRGGEIATAIICIWALLRGGRTERLGSLIILCGWGLTALASQPGMGPGDWVAIIDSVAFLLFAALALWSRKLWTFFAAACLLNAVFVHFAHNLTTFGAYGYATVAAAWGGLGLIICLGVGVATYRRGLKRLAQAPAAAVNEAP